MHLLRYVVKCTVTDSALNTQTSCLKCLPPAWIPFLTHVTRELVTLQSIRSLLCDLIPELILSQKCHIHVGLVWDVLGVMSF